MIYQLDEAQVHYDPENCFIAESADVIGSVTLGESVSVWFHAVVRADTSPVVVGMRTNVQDGAVLHADPGYPLHIGCNVTIGHKAVIHGCTIGDGSLIGINTVVLNGASIGRNCLIGANALIPEGMNVPDGSLVIGSPGKVKRQLSDAEKEGLYESAKHYVENGIRFREGLKIQQ
ncbi:gamma carbonic anhydrase family protein [Enterovibrio makurazakiensis]|uniref:Gamma carbonic anhydrase family protein n=1 Tax=Enterovibrio gelatinilyticus TaxID=2899819 RepID=A0ABT5R3F7_9GAMM|nr:gamma carbonic anhydrase family protein [Enterovibrio sp. ZSDZ42]MDD1794052.1 gamma carbonic anhydrase family protein [Enterovibrio sp. ZSDZ42]